MPIILWPGKPIAQLSFMTLDRPAERPYGHPDLGSHYQSQVDATESRYEGGPARQVQVGSRPMVHALLVLAAEKAEPSKTGFYVVGGALAVWAVVLGVIGLRSPDVPGQRARRARRHGHQRRARGGRDGRRRAHLLAVARRPAFGSQDDHRAGQPAAKAPPTRW